MNSSNISESSTDVRPVVVTLYVIIFLLSLTANSLVIIIVIKYHYTRNVTNLFLVNLSVADLLVTLLCMPAQISNSITVVWYYGEFLCKVFFYMQGVAVSASVFTITAMSIGRYLAITHSTFISSSQHRKWALFAIPILWIIAFIIFIPLIPQINFDSNPILMNETLKDILPPNIDFCSERWDDAHSKKIFGVFIFIFVYAIPGMIMVVAYSLMGKKLCSVEPPYDRGEGSASTQQSMRLLRKRRKVAWILLLIAILFAVCWLPYHTIQLLNDLNLITTPTIDILIYSLLLGHTNSAINPILYCFMTKNFRRSVKKLLSCQQGDLSRRQQQRCRIRWPARAATSSSDYDSHHSPYQKCYLQMHSMQKNPGTQQTTSGTRVSRRLQYVGAISANRRQLLNACNLNGDVCHHLHFNHECERSPRNSDPDYI